MQPVCIKIDTSTVEQLSEGTGGVDVVEGVALSRDEDHPAEWTDNARSKLSEGLMGRSLMVGELSAENVGGQIIETDVTGSEVRFRAECHSDLGDALALGTEDIFVRGRTTVERDRDGSNRRITDAAVGRVVVGSREAALSVHEPESVASLADAPEDDRSFGVAALADVDDLTHSEEYLLRKQEQISQKFS